MEIFAAAMSELYHKSASYKRASAKQLAAKKRLKESLFCNRIANPYS